MNTFKKAFYFLLLSIMLFSTSAMGAIIFSDDFERATIGSNWTTSGTTGINDDTSNSPTHSLYTSGGPSSVTSVVIDTSAYAEINFEAWVRRGDDSFSEDPDSNEDLVLEYRNSSDNWIEIQKFLGSGTPGEIYNISTPLGSDSLHANFQIRISQLDGSSSYDYWHIDDVIINEISIPPVITSETFTIYQGASIGTLIGTVSTSPLATSFSILSGDIDNLFSIDNNGDITVANTLDTNTTDTYDLNISATNAYGVGTEIITINLIDDIELSTDAINTRDFTNVPIFGKDSITINGSILQIGNQILCKNDADFDTCEDPGTTGNTQNNYHTQYFARIDDTVSHSNTMAKLVMQTGDEVIFARLYWSARIDNASNTEIENGKKIKIKGPTSTEYTQLTSLNSKYNWHDSGTNLGDGFFDYVASADVTEYVKTNGEGEYYVGDIQAETGVTGIYASWQLIVIVENTNRSLKNIALYDGFYSIFTSDPYPSEITVPASGFITPTGIEPFDANLFIYGGETDDGYGDSSSILKGDGVTWVDLVDGANDTTDVMNASVYSADYTGGYRSNDTGMANPNFKNVLGVDIDKLMINDKFDVSKQTLSNYQTSTEIKLSSSGDRYSLNMFAFETEVFVPEFCYDYAYIQQGQYFTEDNDGTQSPRLSGNVAINEPIEVTIFLKSMVDGTIQIQDMTIDISDINRTQATYIANSTKLAKIGELLATPVTVTAGTTGDKDYINNVDIGLLNQNDYFYLYYSLDPQISTMDMPINVRATYNLVLDSTLIEYTLKLSEDIPLCSTNNFTYTPAKSIFNVVHNNYYTYDGNSGDKYYNIPTQITKREGNFKVLAMDPENLDSLLNNHPVIIAAVEMIDAGAFHYTDASCKEMESSISEKVWVIFDANVTSIPFDQAALQSAISDGMTKLTDSTDFYTKARQNAAFRITYNSSDENGSLIDLETIDGADGTKYNITSFSSLVGSNCLVDMDNNTDNIDTVATYCSNAGVSYASAMNRAELAACMECIYGYDTRFVCSRDNFSMRPEAFMIKLDDQNQTDPTLQLRIADDVSGVITPSTVQVELAAGYSYNLEINATNHLNNNSSVGYTKTFDPSFTDIAEYTWQPSGTPPTGCNDDDNKSISMRFLDGEVDQNTSVNQVGEYNLNIIDTTWTNVDSNPLYMTHHNGDETYFISSATPDCIPNNSTTQIVNSSTKNGCWISSNHSSSATSLEYRDYNIEFHPYKFEMGAITPSHGINNNTVFDADTFIYMSDMSQDNNMSFHLNGPISALAENNSILSNFVDNCYAKPINLTINKTTANSSIANYRYNFKNTDIAANEQNGTINTEIGTIFLTENDFNKSNNGVVNTNLNLNFDRNVTTVQNPEELTFRTYNSACTTPADCRMNADLINNKETEGSRDLNQSVVTTDRITIKHYYGRTHASRQRYAGNVGTANIYYEVYCFNTLNGNICDPNSLIPISPTLSRTNDIRWYINENHIPVNHGNIGVVIQEGGEDEVRVTAQNNDSTPSTVTMQYDTSSGYPFKTTMENNASGWLIHNEFNINATVNQFQIEFESSGDWSGKEDTTTITKDNNTSTITNRRSMW